MYFDDVFNTASFALLVGSFVRVISAPIIIGSISVIPRKQSSARVKTHQLKSEEVKILKGVRQ